MWLVPWAVRQGLTSSTRDGSLPQGLLLGIASACESRRPSSGPSLDTFVLLTNVTDVPLAVILQLRGGDGQVLGSGTVEIPGRGTRGVSLVDVLSQFSP